MELEFLHWLSDVGSYVRAFGRRQWMRSVTSGHDYTDDKYNQLVRRVVDRLHPDTMRLTLAEVINETSTTKTLRFKREGDALPPFRPGQYVNLFIEIGGILTSRPYSISSAPGAPYLELTVREKPGGFVSKYLLKNAKVGDKFTSSGPTGWFCYEPLIDGDNLVFLAGGSGITPFMSILRDMASSTDGPKVTLIYGSRTKKDAIFAGELKQFAENSDRLKIATVISEPTAKFKGLKGFIDADLIREQVGDLTDAKFYVCGPNAMYDFCIEQLEKLDVPTHKIKRELYGPPDDVTQVPGWPEDIKADAMFEVKINGHAFLAKAAEPLINTLEREGIVVPSLCRSGECSACRMKIDEGKVFMPPETGIRESDHRFGYVHACVSYPVQNLKIRL